MPNIPPELKDFVNHFEGQQLFVSITKDKLTTPFIGSLKARHDIDIRSNNDAGHNLFFTVNETNGKSRKIEDIIRCRAIFGDDDVPREKPRSKWPLTPSIITETSKGKYHYYWLTSTDDFEAWDEVQTGIVQEYGTDKAARDLARVLRLPTTINHKPSANGFICKVVSFPGTIYSWDQILNKFPKVKSPKKQPGISTKSEFNETDLALDFLKGKIDCITPNMNSLVMSWAHHYSDDKINDKLLDLFNAIPQDVYKEFGQRYEGARVQIDKFIKSARKTVDKYRESGPNLHNITTDIWPDPVPLAPATAKNDIDFPINILPDSMLEGAKAIADYNLMPINNIVLPMLSCISTCINRKAQFEEGSPDLLKYFNFGLIVIADSGSYKSTVYNQVSKGLFDAERDRESIYDAQKPVDDQLLKTINKVLDSRVTSVAKEVKDSSNGLPSLKDLTEGNQESALIELTTEKKRLEEGRIPGMLVDNITQETAATVAYHSGGAIGYFAEEGQGILESWSDAYKQGKSSTDLIIRGLSGSAINVKRANKNYKFIICANLSMFIQPDVFMTQFLDNIHLNTTGLAARLISHWWPDPDYTVKKTRNNDRLNLAKLKEYYRITRSLALENDLDHKIVYETNDEKQHECLIKPITRLVISEEHRDWANEVFNKIRSRFGTDLIGLQENLNKCLGTAYCLASCLFAYKNHKQFFKKRKHEVNKEFKIAVEKIVEYLIKVKVSEVKYSDKGIAIKGAKRVLKSLTRSSTLNESIKGMTLRDYKNCINYIQSKSKKELDKGLDLLIEMNLVNIDFSGNKTYVLLSPRWEEVKSSFRNIKG